MRSLGAQLVGKDGTAFVNPLETRDVTASSIIRECKERKNGLKTTDGEGVWLDTPMIDIIHGEGTIEKRIPAMLRMFGKYGLDIRKQPILVYPTLHYQNGGVDISANAESGVKNLFVAGEAAGGIHGTNPTDGQFAARYYRIRQTAGKNAAARAKETKTKELTLAFVVNT